MDSRGEEKRLTHDLPEVSWKIIDLEKMQLEDSSFSSGRMKNLFSTRIKQLNTMG